MTEAEGTALADRAVRTSWPTIRIEPYTNPKATGIAVFVDDREVPYTAMAVKCGEETSWIPTVSIETVLVDLAPSVFAGRTDWAVRLISSPDPADDPIGRGPVLSAAVRQLAEALEAAGR